ncbi:hypothetical protein ACE2AJ_19150 [Aquihabitans daechungensis]|uniref:hypothetical protein n=1 Tax=Aquihabitans daechungensis TaxID=1052257 RepID=UPI003B9E63AD
MPIRSHRLAAWPLAAASLALVVASCSKSEGSDPERTGPTKQAVERLHDYGLTDEQARCVVDEVGAESVVEASDLNALADSQQYRDAAEACLDDA